MSNYRSPGGDLVQAEQWIGEPMEGVEVHNRRYGKVGVIQTPSGPAWLNVGDWLVRHGDILAIVTPYQFTAGYVPV